MATEPQFFDENEAPSEEQWEEAQALKAAIDRVASAPVGWGKTWLLNRAARYIQRVDPHTEDLKGG